MDTRLADARHQADLQHGLGLIRAEYTEIPGLSLTRPQIQRLCGIDDATCDAMLEALEATRFLVRTSNLTYVRAA